MADEVWHRIGYKKSPARTVWTPAGEPDQIPRYTPAVHGIAIEEKHEVSEFQSVEVPETIEGWYVLHDIYTVAWDRWRALPAAERQAVATDAAAWLAEGAAVEHGDSAAYSVLTQKGDLLFIHYRETPDALNRVELGLRQLALFDYLEPAYSYLSVIEVSLYEMQAMALRRLVERGLERGSAEFDEALSGEMERQRERMNSRLLRDVPPQRYACFYPMNKRRGEKVNWYALPLAERRGMMRGHGSIGHKYVDAVTQVIGGSVALDDWEWGVTLHSDDMLVFKKLVYEMRFDAASSWFAEFGPFYLGVRTEPAGLAGLLEGRLE